MKTLNLRSNGTVQFNMDGVYIHTDTSDQDVPSWAMDDIKSLIASMLSDGSAEYHIEDNGSVQFQHRIKNGSVSDWDADLPSVFVNMQQFADEYMTAHQASERAKAEALAVEAKNDLNATQLG